MRRRYEIRDDQWESLKDLLPPERKPQGGRPAIDNRHMLNGMLWVIRSGAAWRDLPDYYGPWSSIYTRFRRWEKAGIFDRMLETLAAEPDSESTMMDASIVRVHQHGAGAKGGKQFQAIGRSRGGLTTKIHAVVDALGNPLQFEVTAGNINDCVVGYEILLTLDLKGQNVLADRGYDTDKIIELLDEKQSNAVIPSRKHRTVQRTTDWYLFKERHLVECLFNKLKHNRRLATRYDKLARTFMAFLKLAASMVWLA
ncbi:IS5 family transposase [Cohnella fermenti]|uniref:IS5 family transposase n=1 Tax=Cohnella fermenti TaxID=2565925 RepID=A0A4S4BKV4_9BACL|nr:IS5 family transposase [Cohnella fermenti]